MTETYASTPRKPATFKSAGAAGHSPDDVSQEVSALLRATDTLQQVRNESDQLLRMSMDDTELLAMAKEIALSQGEALDDSRLAEALDQVKAQRFRFQPPEAQGLPLKLALAWVTRSEWGPRWRLRGLVGTTVAVLAAGAIVGTGEIREHRWEGQLEDSVAAETALRQALEQDLGKAILDPNAPAAVASQVSMARGALASSTTALGQLPIVPATAELREALYQQDRAGAQALLEQRQSQLDKASQLQRQAAQALGKASALQIAYGEAGRFDQPLPAALTGLRDQQRVAFQAAAQQGNVEGMQNASRTLGEAINLIKVRDALSTQSGALSDKSRTTIGQRLNNATTAIATGDLAGGQKMLDDTRDLMTQASLGYTLQVVSEPNVQTGVWRYYNGDRSAKTYYIVVDAVDSNGNKVSLPVTSVEDKKKVSTSRFAVRVPEEVYNQIAKDKTEDGIVDNSLMGTKAVGDLEPTYTFPIDGSAITSW